MVLVVCRIAAKYRVSGGAPGKLPSHLRPFGPPPRYPRHAKTAPRETLPLATGNLPRGCPRQFARRHGLERDNNFGQFHER